MNSRIHTTEIRIGIFSAITITIFAVLFSTINITIQVNNSEAKYLIFNQEGDLTNWFTLIVSLVATPISAVLLSIYLYRKQKSDDEKRDRTFQNEAELNNNLQLLEHIIEPLLDNIRGLRSGFERYQSFAGPYLVTEFERKNTMVNQLALIRDRYNQRPNPDETMILRIEEFRSIAEQSPKIGPSQFKPDLALITDSSRCDEVFKIATNLLDDLEHQRSQVEEEIGRLTDNE